MVGDGVTVWVRCGLNSNLDSATYSESRESSVILNSFACKLQIIMGSVFIRLLKLMTELHNLHEMGKVLHLGHWKVSRHLRCVVAVVGEGDRVVSVLVTEFCFCSTRMEEIHLAGTYNKIKILIKTILSL